MREIRKKDCFCRNIKIVLLALFLSFFVYSCVKVPITGRSQVILVPQGWEIQQGLIAFEEVTKNERISTNPRYNAAVARVVSRVARVSHSPDFDWEYKVIDNDANINAFALPGGKIGIYTGILKIAQTEAGLATVVSHEVAHAVARHGGERVTSSLIVQVGALGLEAVLNSKNIDPDITYGIIMPAYGISAGIGVLLPFSRTQESEADRIGLIYMARAGYDPREAVKFWQRMAELEGRNKTFEFLQTHPDNGTRIENLLKHMPEALDIYERSEKAPNYRITR